MHTDIWGLIGAITGISSLIVSIISHYRTRVYSVHEYLAKVESEDFIKAKKHVYTSDQFEVEDQYAAVIVNFFHHWGMLAKRRYLPMWVFDGATGNGACRLYEKVLPYIQERQEKNNDPLYGEYFTWLYCKLNRRR